MFVGSRLHARHDGSRAINGWMTVAGRLAVVTACFLLTACSLIDGTRQDGVDQAERVAQPIRIELNAEQPSKSFGTIAVNGTLNRFEVGYGKYGIACEGSRFEEGWTPLGRFRVNAVLTADRFEMDPDLVAQSGQSADKLRQDLFANMNSIDFDGDGENGEYGGGYISLAPVPDTDQPFEFNHYAGTFRWYSFAIHGTNDTDKIGRKSTGGCVNVNNMSLSMILDTVQLGDDVVISSSGPCTP